jgi:lipopolysaccharide/colanic/teichoic acid biosynthesis glycosyltransferase
VPIIRQDAFMTTLVAERKRADRSNRPVGLLLVRGPVGLAPEAVAAVRTAVRAADVVGWFQWPTTIGVTLAELRASPPVRRAGIESRVRRRLTERLLPDETRACSIALHVHPLPNDDEAAPIDLELFPDLAAGRLRRPIMSALKRASDIVGSVALLGLFAPLLVAIALAGTIARRRPVFSHHPRLGRRMQPFELWGIATPVTCGGVALDWLPQLWNVLRGDMSLVGPRPANPADLGHCKPWHCRGLLEAKPGLTGLWQLSDGSRLRPASADDEIARRDLRYARTWSLWTDLKILIATPGAVLRNRTC